MIDEERLRQALRNWIAQPNSPERNEQFKMWLAELTQEERIFVFVECKRFLEPLRSGVNRFVPQLAEAVKIMEITIGPAVERLTIAVQEINSHAHSYPRHP